jgi:hypothetical protein
MQQSENIKKVIEILYDEVLGRTNEAKLKTHQDYKMTWVYSKSSGQLFPTANMKNGTEKSKEIYQIKGRVYEIMNIAESENLVMIELIESYPDPETKEVYRTPLVIVLEFEDGKIKRGRHYCDPKLSYMHLTKEQTDLAYDSKNPIIVIKE